MSEQNKETVIVWGAAGIGTSRALVRADVGEPIVVSVTEPISDELRDALESENIVIKDAIDLNLFELNVLEQKDDMTDLILNMTIAERIHLLNGKKSIFPKSIPFYQERGMKRNKKAFYKSHR